MFLLYFLTRIILSGEIIFKNEKTPLFKQICEVTDILNTGINYYFKYITLHEVVTFKYNVLANIFPHNTIKNCDNFVMNFGDIRLNSIQIINQPTFHELLLPLDGITSLFHFISKMETGTANNNQFLMKLSSLNLDLLLKFDKYR